MKLMIAQHHGMLLQSVTGQDAVGDEMRSLTYPRAHSIRWRGAASKYQPEVASNGGFLSALGQGNKED